MSKWTPADDQLLLSLIKGPPALGWQEITRVYNDSRTEPAAERTTRALKDRARLLKKNRTKGVGPSSLSAGGSVLHKLAQASSLRGSVKPKVKANQDEIRADSALEEPSDSDESDCDIIFVLPEALKKPEQPSPSSSPSPHPTPFTPLKTKLDPSPAVTDDTPIPPPFTRSPTPAPPSAPKPTASNGASNDELIALQEKLVQEQKVLVEGLQHLIELKAGQKG